jgi:beta-phosphoglucomutase-like phosphatase (HAD superfamily)
VRNKDNINFFCHDSLPLDVMKNYICIFDMDGLLIDSEPVNKKSCQSSASVLGYVLDEEKYIQLLGMGMRECEQMLLHWFGSDFPPETFQRHLKYILRFLMPSNSSTILE